MREFSKKLGSLALGVGALSLVLVNAAMTHGCARSSTPAVSPQAGRPSEVATPASTGSAAAENGAANPDCTPAPYMYATKAPVWMMLPPECRGEPPTTTPAPQQMPSPGAHSTEQAP